MKLTACSGVAARRSQVTPSAMVRIERWAGCTTETRFAYSEGCHARLGLGWPWVRERLSPLGLARAAARAGRARSLRGSNSSSIETSRSRAKVYRVATEGCDLPFSICDTNEGDTPI